MAPLPKIPLLQGCKAARLQGCKNLTSCSPCPYPRGRVHGPRASAPRGRQAAWPMPAIPQTGVLILDKPVRVACVAVRILDEVANRAAPAQKTRGIEFGDSVAEAESRIESRIFCDSPRTFI